MFILASCEGYPLRGTDGLPLIFKSMDELESLTQWYDFFKGWDVLELSADEARQITNRAYLAIFGRRDGVDL